jgi:hypothetical protein
VDLKSKNVEAVSVNTIRALAMDAVEKAASGHPGTPMSMAPVAYTIYTKLLRHNPDNPQRVHHAGLFGVPSLEELGQQQQESLPEPGINGVQPVVEAALADHVGHVAILLVEELASW